MRASILIVAASLVSSATILVAAPTEFPYEAVVASDGVLVRSGPGERYDPPTMKIDTGTRVTVQRHDPGGWFMISPPPGSFSWINAAYVERTGPETGIVKVPGKGDGLPPRVAVYNGSQFTDEHKYTARQLATGDEVRILGEKTSTSEGDPEQFFKIAPPRHEYRWVKGDFVIPADQASNIAATPSSGPSSPGTSTTSTSASPVDPFSQPLSTSTDHDAPALVAPGFPSTPSTPLKERELSRGLDAGLTGPSLAPPSADRSQLTELDARLKSMLEQSPANWDLAGMEQAYLTLQAQAPPNVAALIDGRLSAINSRKKIKSEYDALINLTTQTEQRDAALLSMQQTLATGGPIAPVPVELGTPTPFPQQIIGRTGQPIVPSTSPTTPPQPVLPLSTAPTETPPMDGAGLIQRLPHPQAGLPRHALMATDGRVLAYLYAGQGVQLDQYVGQSMGVIGKRSHDPRLQNDVIVVQRLTPVRLQP